jgi:Flp pilus assembly pilin Flp
MLKQLWNDEGGAIVSLEIVLIGTILGIGVITGLSSLRDAVITELADVGGAISWLDQSYVLHGSTSHSSATANTRHIDQRDFCDNGPATNERCLVICNNTGVEVPPGSEGGNTPG